MKSLIAVLAAIAALLCPLADDTAHAQAPGKAPWTALSERDINDRNARPMLESVLEESSMADLRAAARRGDARAQWFYGFALTSGNGGVAKDPAKGFEYYTSSCSAGVTRGCTSMGYSYLNGAGVREDAARALDQFEAGCKAGSGRACVAAGYLYNGDKDGVAKDTSKRSWRYHRACELGYSDGCRRAGNLYRIGSDVPKDEVAAQMYYADGCEYGNSSSCFYAGRLLEKASNPADSSKFATIAAFYERGCERGSTTSCYNRGIIENEGKFGRRQSTPAAVPWMEKACDGGYNDACYNLGSWLIDGRAGRTDGRRAIALLGALCLREKDPDIQACNNAGTAAYRGSAMPQPDYASARKFYERACSEGGLVASCRTLSDMYRDGQIRESGLGEREWLDAQLCFKSEEQNYCRPQTRQYVVLLRAGQGNFPSAATVAGDLCEEGDMAACRTERLLNMCQANSATRSACRRAFD